MTSSQTDTLLKALGVQIPILQSGMGGVAGPELVAAVSNAGGLGILAALRLTPDRVRQAIGRVRQLTDKPFGVNIWLHEDVRASPDPGLLSDDLVHQVQAVLNEFRPRFELTPRLDTPPAAADLVDDALQVMIDERIPVFSAAIGIPEPDLIARFHAAGSQVVSMVADLNSARQAADSGVDVIVAQGTEAGGHRSYGSKLAAEEAVGHPLESLVPDVLATVGQTPVVAAGGIVTGADIAAALNLGAHGVLLGTRFVATRESQASEVWKRRIIGNQNESVLTDGFSGQWARVLRSEFTDRWQASGVRPLPGLLQGAVGGDLFAAAKDHGDDQLQPLYIGEGAPRIVDLPGAGEVVQRLMDELASSR